jgi:ankyrin repeat protein
MKPAARFSILLESDMRPSFRFRPTRGLVAFASATVLFVLPGCGGSGRDKAREEIRQANHSFTAADFVKAAGNGDQALVEAYLQGGMDRNAQDARGFTALMAAAQAGKNEVVKALLDENAKPDLQNNDGATALILAAAADQPLTVRTLIEANADVRLKDHKNWTALMRAVYDGKDRVVDVLLATSRDQLARDKQLDRALAVASLLGRDGIVRQLLDHGANVNATIENHQTALMYAAMGGKQSTVELLLDRQADPHPINADSASASILALQRGHPEIAKLIDNRTPGLIAAAAATTTGTPAPLPLTDAEAKQAAAKAAGSNEDRAWLKQNGLEATAAAGKENGPDDDGDGFTNEEEIAAGTDPRDPKSHPPYYSKLRLKRIEGEAFPVVFDGFDSKKIHVTVREEGSDLPDGKAERKLDVSPGERIGDLPYVVFKVRRRDVEEKDTGKPLDMSELTLANPATGEKIVLVKSMPANSPDATALLSDGAGQPDIPVKLGQQFTIPRDGQNRYEVIDIRPTQVILKIVGSSQTITVPTDLEPPK